MILNQPFTMHGRKEAALMLAGKLMLLKDSNAIVVGIPYGGAVVAYHLANELGLVFDVTTCKPIAHPDRRKTIGSVSINQVVIHDDAYDIPRDYIFHQILRNQSTLKAREEFYRSGKRGEIDIEGAEVIVVGDIVKSADSLLASIRTLRNRKPKRIIVAAPVVTPDARRHLISEVDEVIFLFNDCDSVGFYEVNTFIRDEDIRDLLLRSHAN